MKYSVAVDWTNLAFGVIVHWKARAPGENKMVVLLFGPYVIGLEGK